MISRFLIPLLLILFIPGRGHRQQADVLIVPKDFEKIFRLWQQAQGEQTRLINEEEKDIEKALYYFNAYPRRPTPEIMSSSDERIRRPWSYDYKLHSPWPWYSLETHFEKGYVWNATEKLFPCKDGRCRENVSKLFQIRLVDRHKCTVAGYWGLSMETKDVQLFDHDDLDFRKSIKESQLTFEEKRLLLLAHFPVVIYPYIRYRETNPSSLNVESPSILPPHIPILKEAIISFHLWMSDFINDHVRFDGE